MPSPTSMRDKAVKLALSDTSGALSLSRKINDPWFACQTLAWVARYASDGEYLAIIRESLQVASKDKDPFKEVGASAWPVRAVIERNENNEVKNIISKLLNRAKAIDSPASRSQALFLLFSASFPAGRKVWKQIFDMSLASMQWEHWREERNLRDMVLIIASVEPKMAQEICESLPESKAKRQINKGLASGETQTTRDFFW